MTKPISPDEAVQSKVFPDVVIETFNILIARNLVDGQAMVRQGDVLDVLALHNLYREEIFKEKWLDVEDVFRDAGWDVEYCKIGSGNPDYSTFTFRRKS